MIVAIKPEGSPAIKIQMPNGVSPAIIDRTIGQALAGLLDGRGAHFQACMTSFDKAARCTAMRVVTENQRSVAAEITYHNDESETSR